MSLGISGRIRAYITAIRRACQGKRTARAAREERAARAEEMTCYFGHPAIYCFGSKNDVFPPRSLKGGYFSYGRCQKTRDRHAARLDLEQASALCPAGGGNGDSRAALQRLGSGHRRQLYGRGEHAGGRGRGREQPHHRPHRQSLHRHRAWRERRHRHRHRLRG